MTFQDAIDLVKGRAGIFPELKGPERLRAKGLEPRGCGRQCPRTQWTHRRDRQWTACRLAAVVRGAEPADAGTTTAAHPAYLPHRHAGRRATVAHAGRPARDACLRDRHRPRAADPRGKARHGRRGARRGPHRRAVDVPGPPRSGRRRQPPPRPTCGGSPKPTASTACSPTTRISSRGRRLPDAGLGLAVNAGMPGMPRCRTRQRQASSIRHEASGITDAARAADSVGTWPAARK